MSNAVLCNVPPSPDLLAFAKRQVKHAASDALDVERRCEKRAAFAVPAVLQKVDRDWMPLGEPFAAATRDMTADGLGLIVADDLTVGDLYWVRVVVNAQEPCLLVETLWCRPMGPYYYAGFRAVSVVGSVPSHSG